MKYEVTLRMTFHNCKLFSLMIVISDTSCIGNLIIIYKCQLLKDNLSQIIRPYHTQFGVETTFFNSNFEYHIFFKKL